MRDKKLWIVGALAVTAMVTVLAFGCGAPALLGPSVRPGVPAQASAPSKVLPVAMNIAALSPSGADGIRVVQAEIDGINRDGGLQVGPDRYTVRLIVDDNKGDPAAAAAAEWKEVETGAANFILGDSYASRYLGVADRAGVMVFAYPNSMEDYDSRFRYEVHASINNTTLPSIVAYAWQKFPTLTNMAVVLPDNANGHARGWLLLGCGYNSGMKKVSLVYYAPDASDLAAVAARVKELNPDFLVPYAGGPALDGRVIKAAHDAGFTGKVLYPSTVPAEQLVAAAGPDALEGVLMWAWPTEFNPALNPQAAALESSYAAKFGKWDSPDLTDALQWWTLKAALQQAGSVDPDKVAAAVFDRMSFESPAGASLMVRRHDLGNDRSIELAVGLPLKQIVGGKAVKYDVTAPDQVFDYVKEMYGVHCRMDPADF